MQTEPQISLSRQLCTWVSNLRVEDIPEPAMHAARRGVLDWLGCAYAGSSHPTLEPLIAVLTQVSGAPVATVIGRGIKLGLLDAPIINGYAGHALDYDDTHLGGTILHASSPMLGALFALCEQRKVSGSDLLLAYICGFEAAIRCGQASPGHHKGGWHITGTLGTMAAGVASAKLLGLDGLQTTYALGAAASQAAGMQQNRGTMCKYLHAGKAAANGLLSGLLAQRNFDSSEEIIEGKDGFCRVYSDVAAPQALLDGLGTRWEITRNGYKPYACAAVLHPIIDAMIAVRERHAIDPGSVERIELYVNPNVLKISGVQNPQSGMQSKFSVYHTAAVALIDGAGGIAQYGDERVRDPSVIRLAQKVVIHIDPSLEKDQTRTKVSTAGGSVEAVIEHANGTADNPMTDEAVQAKFMANAADCLAPERAQALSEKVWKLERLADVRDIASFFS